MEQFTLTKEEFIKRSINGEVFLNEEDNEYFYNSEETIPFRFNDEPLHAWYHFSDGYLFTLKNNKPIIERRWRWLMDSKDHTTATISYHPNTSLLADVGDWYKHPTDYIDVELRDH